MHTEWKKPPSHTGPMVSRAMVLIIMVFLLSFLPLSCGVGSDGGVSLHLRFSQVEQAQSSPRGLPLGIKSFRVEAYSQSIDGILQGGTGCLNVGADDEVRRTLSFDLLPQDGLVVVAEGWGVADCPETTAAEWLGLATGVDVMKGKESLVSIFVTRRGLTLNDTLDQLPGGLAFASATTLKSGKVLIAGGFDTLVQKENGAELGASSLALLYDPQTGSFESLGSLSESRGLHRALRLSDGRVMLIGGAKKLLVNFTHGSIFQLVESELVSSVDVYDPQTGGFDNAGADLLVARAGAAALIMAGDHGLLMGGQTSVARTDDLVMGVKSGRLDWTWSKKAGTLAAERKGARALAMDDGILVVGGNADGDYDMEIGDEAFGFSPLELGLGSEFAVTGHTLVAANENAAILAGGLTNFSGEAPLDALVEISFEEPQISARETRLSHPRAWHRANLMRDGNILFSAGLSSNFELATDLELFTPGETETETLAGELECGSIGLSTALLPDGSILLLGGLTDESGTLVLSPVAQLLSP